MNYRTMTNIPRRECTLSSMSLYSRYSDYLVVMVSTFPQSWASMAFDINFIIIQKDKDSLCCTYCFQCNVMKVRASLHSCMLRASTPLCIIKNSRCWAAWASILLATSLCEHMDVEQTFSGQAHMMHLVYILRSSCGHLGGVGLDGNVMAIS